eukprot:13878649-Ditylum_brightwellii.AAC.1
MQSKLFLGLTEKYYGPCGWLGIPPLGHPRGLLVKGEEGELLFEIKQNFFIVLALKGSSS